MLDKFSFGRLVANAAVLLVVVILLSAGLDRAASWLGYQPGLGCGLMLGLTIFCWTVALILTFAGAAIYLLSLGGRGAGMFFGGLVVGVLPMLVDSYMGRLFGLGCIG